MGPDGASFCSTHSKRILMMLTVSKPSGNRIDIELSGMLDAEAMGVALDNLVAASEGITNGKILYTIQDFEMPTIGAMAAELSRMPKLLGLIRKFDKCAVLCDAAWVRTAAQIEGAVIPSLAIKSFQMHDIAAAEAWLQSAVQDSGSSVEDENFPV
jgi:hypothetical protein